MLDHIGSKPRTDSRTHTRTRQDEVTGDVEADSGQHMTESRLVDMLRVSNQNDFAAREPPLSKPFGQQVPHQCSIRQECQNAQAGKEHARATRKSAADLQREAAESFVKDWNEMLASIASKSAAFKAAG